MPDWMAERGGFEPPVPFWQSSRGIVPNIGAVFGSKVSSDAAGIFFACDSAVFDPSSVEVRGTPHVGADSQARVPSLSRRGVDVRKRSAETSRTGRSFLRWYPGGFVQANP